MVDMKTRRWTQEEVRFLKKEYDGKNAQSVGEKLDRTLRSVQTKASELGLSKGKSWSQVEIKFLRENYLKLGAKEVAVQLGRTLSAIHTKIREIGGGRKSIGPRRNWTKDELEFLRENYQKLSWDELTQQLDRTKSAIQVRARMLHIKKYIDPYLFFETWTENSAYAIGFFAADGWITKRGPQSIRVGFSQKEPDIIYALRDIIGAGRITAKSDGMYEYYMHSIRSYERLCAIFGQDVYRKSQTIRWPSVPDEYTRHFIRGAMDGDGSLMRRKDKLWEIAYATSSKSFIDSLAENILRLTGILLNVGLNKIGVYHARCVGIKTVCLAKWLYDDCGISIERKAWIAREMMETRGQAHEASLTPKMREMFPGIISGYSFVG